MITPVKEILEKARVGGYAVGAFNTVNLETTRAIIEAAQEMRSPVIVQITEKTMEYAGGRMIYHLVKNDAEFYAPEIPIGIHLDHGKSFEIIQRAVQIGFTSVMYDGSRKKFVDNLDITKKVVDFCHDKGVNV
ncbi:MAG TPA: class II fructose-bisphosphate aldolase, partial [Patescibacteria group bacterium]|nr:class II fructose-bisphosphate aldolase [Patescibacteria group bacterium]